MPRMEPIEPTFTTVIWTDGQSDDECDMPRVRQRV